MLKHTFFPMKNLFVNNLALALLASATVLVSCSKKDAFIPSSTQTISYALPTRSTTVATTSIATPAFNLSVNWNNAANGAYGYTQALQDFKNVIYWADPIRSQTNNGRFRATLLKNTLTEGGVLSGIDIPDGSEYQLQFDMMFDQQFDFSWGGKVGFGFLIGNGYTGGGNAASGDGGSARLMWYKNTSTGPVFLKPYMYHKDQTGTWGEDFGAKYPASGSIQKGVWYTVKMYVRSNNGSNTDGRMKMDINGTTVMDRAMRWTTNDTKRLINKLSFENFRGGGETYWQSSTDGYIYFDNLSVTALKL